MRKDTKASIDRYVRDRCPTGDFLYAVLTNNLKSALGRADSDNLRDIAEIVAYCYNEIPSICWGSPEAVHNWLSPNESEEAQKYMDDLERYYREAQKCP